MLNKLKDDEDLFIGAFSSAVFNDLPVPAIRLVYSNDMSNPLKLIPGQKYILIKPFTDYDRYTHPIGETWIFVRTNFLPYEDGLTLHVLLDGIPNERICRLQWRQEQQADIIENFPDYVKPC